MNATIPKPTGEWSATRFAIAGTVLLAIAFAVVTVATSPRVMENTVTIGVITGTAVAIERAIEVIWILVSLKLGSWWPLDGVTRKINSQIADLNDNYLRAFVIEAQKKLADAERLGTATADDVAAVTRALAELNTSLQGWGAAAPDNQRLRALVALLSDRIVYIGGKLDGLQDAVEVARKAVDSLTNFADSFVDNPGKRLVSIYLGAMIGVPVSGVLGLDLFQAVLDTSTTLQAFGMFDFHPGVALTGLVVGLGSSPTHEVIKLLTEIKKNRRAQNERMLTSS
jgi:hypothetical protein